MRRDFSESEFTDPEGARITDVAVAHGYFPDKSRVWFVIAKQADGQLWRASHSRLGEAGALLAGMLGPTRSHLQTEVAEMGLGDLSKGRRGRSLETNRENAVTLREMAAQMRAQSRVLCYIARIRMNLLRPPPPGAGRLGF